MAINFFNSLAVGTDVLYVDTLNDRVGIGTSSPDTGTNLHVLTGTGSGQIKLSSQANTQFQFHGDGNQDINYGRPANFPDPGGSAIGQIRYSHGSNYMAFKVNNAEMVRFASNNYVGIGTTSPSEKLDVSGTIQSSANEGKIIINSTATNGKEYQLISIDTGNLGLFDGTAYRLWVAGSGNIGIGTTSPSTKLHLSDTSDSIIRIQRVGVQELQLNSDGTVTAASTDLKLVSTGNISFTASGSERMKLDSSGRLGLGTSSPSFPLHVVTDSGTYEVVTIQNGSSAALFRAIGSGGGSVDFGAEVGTADTAIIRTGSTERMRIDSSGRVGIGTTSPNLKLHVSQADGSAQMRLERTGSNTGSMILGADGDGLKIFNSSVQEKMRITSGGDLLIGSGGAEPSATQIGLKIGYASSGTFVNNAKNITTTTAHINFFNPNGLVGAIKTSGSSTSYVTSSDYRLKENVVDMTGALDRVDQLEPKRFNFIADEDTTVDGFLAHEVQDIVPEAVTGEKDEVDEDGNDIYQGIDQSKLVPLLVGAIKELRAEVNSLKAQINN